MQDNDDAPTVFTENKMTKKFSNCEVIMMIGITIQFFIVVHFSCLT